MVANPLPAASDRARVFVVDDHRLFLDGLIRALNTTNEFCVVGSANEVETAQQQLAGLCPDILIVDLMMPGQSGMELIQAAVKNRLATHVIACSGTSNRHSVAAAIASGARCFFEKSGSFEALLDTLREVNQGGAPMGELERSTLREVVAGRINAARYSAKELEILRGLANEESPKTLAAKLGLSVSAIYKTKQRLLAQTNSKSVVLLAIQLGVIPVDGWGPKQDLHDQC
jgi:DNA-binding NarL/FixJ family response regulator